MIDQKKFLELAELHLPHCVSIYFHMDEYEKNRITLKNLAQKTEKILSETYHLDDKQIKTKISKVYTLIDDVDWMNKSDIDVAIFLIENNMELIEFNGHGLENQVRVSDHPFLLPLTPSLNGTHKIYLLALSINETNLFEVSGEGIKESAIAAKLPKDLIAVVGGDVEQKSLQFRSGQQSGGGEGSIFHGQGSGNDSEKKQEYLKYFQEIDKHLNANITDQSVPLVLACVDYLYPIYKEANSYQNLYPEFLSGNYDEMHPKNLFQEGKKFIEQMREKEQKERQSDFEGMLSKQLASAKIQDIVPSSFEGKIESLYVKKASDISGKYIKDQHKIEIDTVSKTNNASLLNMAAVNTIKTDGQVFIVPESKMPVKDSEICAVYRYNQQN